MRKPFCANALSLILTARFCAGGKRPDPKKIRQRMRKDHCSEVRIGKTVYVDDLRWEWAQFDSSSDGRRPTQRSWWRCATSSARRRAVMGARLPRKRLRRPPFVC